MAKYKNFGELKEKDYIFSVSIKNSNVIQNCVGNIYDRYIITKIHNEPDSDDVVMTIAYDKSAFLKQWKFNENNTDITIVKACANAEIRILELQGDKDKANYILFGTNIEAIVEKMDDIIADEKEKLETLKRQLNEKELEVSNLISNYNIRRIMCDEFIETNKKPEYKEVIVTEEVIV